MQKSFRFLHCGDVHLGAGRQVHPERYLDLFRVFEEVTKAAESSDIDALLISGDLFDVKEPDVETLARAVSILKCLRVARPGLAIVAIEGNHDMRKRARGAHRNERGVLDILQAAGLVTLLRPKLLEDDSLDFSDAVFTFDDHDIAVVGLGYWRENVGHRFRQAMDAADALPQQKVICLAHLMIMHPGLEPYHGSAWLEDLLPVPEKVVYVGLGHGHSKVDASSPLHGGAFFSPGSLEFVHARNTRKSVDTRGYFDVTMSETSLSARHRPTETKRPFVHLKIDLERLGALSFAEVRQAVLEDFRSALPPSDMRPILSVQFDGKILFPATSFRTSVIQRDLVDTFQAIQTFVRRGVISDDQGVSVGFDIEGGYEDAVVTVLSELLDDAREALGLPENDTFLSQNLLEALRGEGTSRDALERCRAHLESMRMAAQEDVQVHIILQREGDSVVDAVCEAVSALEILPDQGVSLRLGGQAPVDRFGCPVVPTLPALEELVLQKTGALRCAIRVDGCVFAVGGTS